MRDAPDAPSSPSATEVRSRTAVLKWAPPSDNGAAITGYTVRSNNGFEQKCGTTTCTLTGLTNDVKYVFTVTATNEVGDSQASPQSNEIRPDEKPSPPEAPTVKAGDKNMVINWPAAKSEGSAVKHYNLEISPPPATGIAVKNEVAGLNYTWTGLTNGVKYKVRAQAVNELGPSDWGTYSAEDNPAGVPAAPAAPTSAVASSVGTQNQLKVNWTEPSTNGDPISNYYVTMGGGGGPGQTQIIAGTVRTANFTANNSEAAYTFTVQAENKAGKGGVSQPSAPRRATGKLGQVSGVSATPANTGGAGRSVTVDFRRLTAAERNGSAENEVTYSYNASDGTSGPVAPGQVIGGFTNGAQVSITVIANSAVAPSSNASAPASATPYGNPGTPAAAGQNGGTNDQSVTLSWSSPSTASFDVAVTKIRIDNGGWQDVAPSGSRTVNTGGFNRDSTITVQTFNSVGTPGGTASHTARSGQQRTSWDTQVTGYRTCTDTAPSGQTSWDTSVPGHLCGGKDVGAPWIYIDTTFQVNCQLTRTVPDSRGTGQWYRISSHPNGAYVGRFISVSNTTMGWSGEVPAC